MNVDSNFAELFVERKYIFRRAGSYPACFSSKSESKMSPGCAAMQRLPDLGGTPQAIQERGCESKGSAISMEKIVIMYIMK
jgi:hypothetical protein